MRHSTEPVGRGLESLTTITFKGRDSNHHSPKFVMWNDVMQIQHESI